MARFPELIEGLKKIYQVFARMQRAHKKEIFRSFRKFFSNLLFFSRIQWTENISCAIVNHIYFRGTYSVGFGYIFF